MTPPDIWISPTEFAALIGISRQKAGSGLRKCLEGKTWRGHQLQVRAVHGRGGRAGVRYEVALASLPADLQVAWAQQNTRKVAVIAPERVKTPQVRLGVINAVQAHKPRSPERAEAVRQAAQATKLSERRINDLAAKFGDRDLKVFFRKPRADKQKLRCRLWRDLDKALDNTSLTAQERDDLDDVVRKIIISLWRSGAPSARQVAILARPHIIAAIEQTGCGLSRGELMKLASAPPNFIRYYRRYRMIHRQETDAGTFAAENRPRIRRHRDDLEPMQVVALDVKHLDIYLQRNDGSLATPKLICFADLACNRLFFHVVLLEKGKGVRQEHVLEAITRMLVHPEWGVPGALYVDNGSENGALNLVEPLMELSFPVMDGRHLRDRVIKAQPYNAPAKVIESFFASLRKQIEPMIPGYIGGDRMKKKVANQGKAPDPFPGPFDDFMKVFNIALDYWHALEQRGHLKGQSPHSRFQAWRQHGWQASIMLEKDLPALLCDEFTRKVGNGGTLSIDGVTYYAAELTDRIGETVIVRKPKNSSINSVIIRDEKGAPLCIAQPEEPLPFLDQAGAQKARQRIADQRGVFAEARADAGPRVPLVDSMAAAAALGRDPAAANVIEMNGQLALEGRKLIAGPRKAKHQLPVHDKTVSDALALLAKKSNAS